MINFGKRLSEEMERKGVSVQDLAKKLGKNEKTIRNYKNGETLPDIGTFVKLCEVLDTDEMWMMYG